MTLELTPTWRAWVVENLARGVPHSQISNELVAAGFATDPEAVTAIAAATDLAMVAELLEATRRRQTIVDLQRDLRAKAPIAVAPGLSPQDFFSHYFFANRPVVVPGFAAQWPAFNKWSHEWFSEHYGEVPVQVCVGRNGDKTPDRNASQHATDTTLGAFIAKILEAGATNDLYAVSSNKLIERAELATLLDDVCLDPSMFPPERHGPASSALWIGPAGTVTPLHHDTTNVMFCQLQGSKQVTLASPFETRLADTAYDFYAEADVGASGWDAHFGEVSLAEVTLTAGDALFIPVGWWHRVVALEPSISLGLMGFAEPNDYSWYRPGSLIGRA